MPPDYSDSWKRLVAGSKVPICTGENLARRHGFKDFIINQGCDILHPIYAIPADCWRPSGSPTWRNVRLPVANHNTGSMVNTMTTIQWASRFAITFMRDHVGQGDWMDEVLVHDGKIFDHGYITVPNKPGLGLELNADVVKAHLAPGEKYWG